MKYDIVIIGGGVIGVEFATFYSHLGCQVLRPSAARGCRSAASR